MCALPDKVKCINDEPSQVLLRLFGKLCNDDISTSVLNDLLESRMEDADRGIMARGSGNESFDTAVGHDSGAYASHRESDASRRESDDGGSILYQLNFSDNHTNHSLCCLLCDDCSIASLSLRVTSSSAFHCHPDPCEAISVRVVI